MTDAPERIWLQLGAGDYGTHTWCDQPQGWADENGEGEPEYIRADLHAAAIAKLKAENARLRGFVTGYAMRALFKEHERDEQFLLDHDTLLFQRDCDIVEARAALKETDNG